MSCPGDIVQEPRPVNHRMRQKAEYQPPKLTIGITGHERISVTLAPTGTGIFRDAFLNSCDSTAWPVTGG